MTPALCLCGEIPKVDVGFPVSVLQHNGERRKPTSTGKLLPRVFAGSAIHHYAVRDVPFDPVPFEGDPPFLLLFPSDESTIIQEDSLTSGEKGHSGLLLLDGTWAQASHMRRRLPCIGELRTVRVVPDRPTRWTLRIPQQMHQRCTLETALLAVETLAGAEKVAPIWEFFDRLTARLLFMRGDLKDPEPPNSWRRRYQRGSASSAFLGIVAAVLVVTALFLGGCSDSSSETEEEIDQPAVIVASHVGSESCRPCHEKEFAGWSESHHARAEVAFDEATHGQAFALGAALLNGTETTTITREDGQSTVARQVRQSSSDLDQRNPVRVIGVDPLWQVLLPGERGRLQASAAAFDVEKGEWFDVFGADGRTDLEWGHWTQRGMTWNSMCATCHVTAFRKNYRVLDDSYQSTFTEPRVGCESCHGPQSTHVQEMEARQPPASEAGTEAGSFWVQPAELRERATKAGSWPIPQKSIPDNEEASCGKCHARRVDLTGEFEVGDEFLDHFSLVLPDETDVFHVDGQIREEDYEYASFLGSRMHAAGVRCNHCHDPHTSRLRLEGNALCLSCHQETIDPAAHAHHELGTKGSNCVDCHMPTTVYMQRDPRHDHSFSIPTPELTVRYGVPNACNSCHKEKEASWSVEILDKWFPDRTERPAALRAKALAAVREGEDGSFSSVAGALSAEELPFWKAALTGVLSATDNTDAAAKLLIKAMESPDALQRWAAVQGGGEVFEVLPGPELYDALQGRLLDDSAAVRVAAAWALRRHLEQSLDAARELQAYLVFNADQPAGAVQLGTWHFDRANGRVQSLKVALDWLEKAALWDNNSPIALHGCAVVLSALGDSRGAAKLLEKALRLDADNVPWIYALALAVNENGDLKRSTRLLQKVCRLDPEHVRARYNLALALVAGGRLSDGLMELDRVIRAAPESQEFLMARVAILRDAGRLPEAIVRLREVVKVFPDNRQFLELLHQMLLATGDARGASEVERRLRRRP